MKTVWRFVTVVAVLLGLIVSAFLLINSTPFWCGVTSTAMLIWLMLAAILAATRTDRWRAFWIVALVVPWMHLVLANFDAYTMEPAVFPTTMMLDKLWHLIRVKKQSGEIGFFTDQPLSEYDPAWFYFFDVGVYLASVWLGIAAGGVAFFLAGRVTEHADGPRKNA